MKINLTNDLLIQPNKIQELESIRGLAALLVLFFHIPKWNPILNIELVKNGYLMVDLFFVLSGFLIFNSYSNKITTIKELLNFQFLRLGRLYPVHFLFLILFFSYEIIKHIAQSNFDNLDIRGTAFSNNSFTAFIEQLFLVQAIGSTGNSRSFNGPAWSISVEFYSYLIFGIVILLFKQRKTEIILLISFISITLLFFNKTYGFIDILRCLGGFSIGCLTSVFINKTSIALPSYLSFLIFIIITFFLNFKEYGELDIAIYFFSSALIVSIVLSKGGIFRMILNANIFKLIGLISYSIYMSHSFIILFFEILLRRFFNMKEIQTSDGKLIISLTNIETFITLFILFLTIFIVSLVSYKFIEKPMREKSRNYIFNK